MRLKGNVSSFSFYLFMAVVQISCFFGFFAHLPQGVTAYGIILALPFAFVISAVIMYFAFKLFDNYGSDTSKALKKGLTSSAVVYKYLLSVFLLLAAIITVMRYTDFVAECINKEVSPIILIFLTMCGVLYGSCKGLEAMCGANGIIFTVCVILLTVLFIGLIPQISIDEGTIAGFSEIGIFSVLSSLVYLISGLSALPLCIILSEKSKGRNRRSAVGFLLIYYLTAIISVVFVIICLGVFSIQENNPLYVLSKLSGMSIIEENDGLFFIVRTAFVFLELSGYAIGFSSLFERSGSRKSSIVFCLLTFAVSEILYEFLKLRADIFAYGIVFGMVLISVVAAVFFKRSVTGGTK